MAAPQHFDVIALGGGSGLTAAYWAGKDGKSVAVIESQPDAFGGTCVNRGCIPTKGLIQTAEVLETIRGAGRFGVEVDEAAVRVDFARVMEIVRERRAEGAGGTREWVEGDFTPFYGHARFVGDKLLEMEDGTRFGADAIFLAAGARPAIPPIEGLDGIEYLTNESVLELTEKPESLLILGGGYIGCELGHFFAALGTRVTIVNRSGLLGREDDEVSELVAARLAERMELVLGATAIRAGERGGEKQLVVEQSGETRTLGAEALLVAAGRAPNTADLGLEETGVETDGQGWIAVDSRLRTSHPDIYAYGDVIGEAMFKHTSSYEGELAYRNSQGAELEVSYRANPHAVFTDPQIGAVGLTERECAERGLRYRVGKKDYASVAKGKIIGSPPGFAKVIVEEESDRILGFHIAGPGAADLVHEVVVAMNAPDAGAALIRDTIHIHPTLPELIRGAFDEV